MTEILRTSPDHVDVQDVARVVETLEAAGVVAFRTDTVYGLAARIAFPSAVERIYAAKGRPPEKRIPFLIPDAERVSDFVTAPPPRAARLAAAFWPGPLTVVLGPDDQTVGLRVPDEDFLREVLRRVSGPVAVTSANKSGAPEALDAESVRRDFDGSIELVVDRGRAPGGVASTVARVAPNGALVVLRRGPIEAAALKSAAPLRVVVVCTGNTCRSPMAAAFLRIELANRIGVPEAELPSRGFDVRSAGVSAAQDEPATREARRAAAALGADIASHRATYFDAANAAEADVVFALTRDHVRRAEALAGPKAVEVFDPTGADVPDPFGADYDVYRAVAARLRSIAEGRAARLLAFENDPGAPLP